MNNKKNIIFIIIISIILLFIFCFNFLWKKKVKKIDLNISSAISLKDSLEEIKYIYENKNKNIDIIFNFSSSGSLQRQIEQGAPVDIFISASNKEIKQLEKKYIIKKNSSVVITKNRIVLITNKNNNILFNWTDLTSNLIKKIAIGEIESVPVGDYGKDVLNYFNIYDKILNKFIFAKNAKEILFWVESNNVDAGIVYLTDAIISIDKIKIIKKAPLNSHKEIVYLGVLINSSKHIKEAEKFLKFIVNFKNKKIFKKFGFIDKI